MTPEARVQAAIEILEETLKSHQPVDRYLKYWFTGRRFAGSKDRSAISEHVYACLRRRAEFSWRMQSDSPRSVMIARLLDEGMSASEIESLFAYGSYGPPPLTEQERTALNNPSTDEVPDYVRGGYPEWLDGELERAFGERKIQEMQAMLARAPVDLRVNTLRAARDDMLVGLQGLGFEAAPTPYSPVGIRIPSQSGLGALRQSNFFQTGAVEIQDEASQIAVLICDAKPGMRVLDLAAGAGGKSLALAAIMENKGEIIACDSNAKRLAQLSPRARRAGAKIIRTLHLGKQKPQGEFDLVLLDAPCSGSGTWRRSPELKWRLDETRLGEFTQLQSRLLDHAARYVAPSGRLIYATCSILPTENQERIDAFLSRHPDFKSEDIATLWQSAVGTEAPPGMDHFFVGTPATTGTDGFFASVLVR
jgi:16S rRNA (cytosine967-C5)-methyltransferase